MSETYADGGDEYADSYYDGAELDEGSFVDDDYGDDELETYDPEEAARRAGEGTLVEHEAERREPSLNEHVREHGDEIRERYAEEAQAEADQRQVDTAMLIIDEAD